jgi:ribosomal protein S18 acetylase RimI-like enzyme
MTDSPHPGFLADLGLLALGSRTRALSERLYAVADEVYRAKACPLEGRWFPLLRFLDAKGPQTVGAAAEALGQTHSAVSQLADKLVRGGWLAALDDDEDRRRRRLGLTAKARSALAQARPAWRAIEEVLAERCRAAQVDFLGALDRFESQVDATLAAAIVERCAGQVRIVPFEPELREHFYRLNAAWLEKYFYLEEIDHRVLSSPEREILEPGGAIFFACAGEEVVGTCALMRHPRGRYELTKMAVAESHQGQGIGRLLLQAAIADFGKRKGKTLFLESSSKLQPALHLYESLGFEHQPAKRPGSHYRRSDVYMIWRVKKADRGRSRG